MQDKSSSTHSKRATRILIGVATSLILITAAFYLPLTESSCNFAAPSVDARITYFMPASGTYYPEESVTSHLRFKNSGREPWTFWVSYSAQDQAGQWYNTTSHSVTLEPKVESPIQSKTWHVPAPTLCVTGYYSVAMAVWDTRPEDGDAIQLAHREQQGSFQILHSSDFKHFDSLDVNLWNKSSHRLGKSYLNTNNVDFNNGHARIRIPAETLAGGEFSSTLQFKYGTYRASMLLPHVPGAITGFFLYQGPSGANDEIDIEIYNDGNWQIEFTTWLHGIETNTVTKPLKFDPSAGYHEYRIDFYPQEVSFFVDGRLLQRYTSGLPTEAMKLLVNTWFPDWLPGVPPSTDKYTYVDWIQY